MKKKDITCIIQARTESSRLPGKILLPGYNKPLLVHLVERLKKSKLIKKIIVATTINKIDDGIFHLCKLNKIEVFRGNALDLLDRYYKCSIKYKVKNILRITSDCPLMDYRIIDKVIKKYISTNCDFVSNVQPPTLPDGFDVEIFKFKALKKAYFEANQKYEREHVTPYIWDNPSKFSSYNCKFYSEENYYNRYRLTLDYLEDYHLIWNIYKSLYSKNKYFSLEDVLNYLKKNKSIITNKKYIKVNWYRHHLKNLKTISRKDTNFKVKYK
tara:strand:+ start:582 stop:1391 length:810 start_codon:yes stop_codon:yes gene_type:complete